MIDLFTWDTPNGRKVHIMLEECGLRYHVTTVDITRGEQHEARFVAVNPNARIPAIVDRNGPGRKPITIFESGAILIYLAEKSRRFLPSRPRERSAVLQWLMWQMGNFGPMLGQTHHFRRYAPTKIPYAIDRYTNEASRLYAVLDEQLSRNEYVAGRYSIADMAIFPWARLWKIQGQDMASFPSVVRWMDAVGGRPGVQRGTQLLSGLWKRGPLAPHQREALFGSRGVDPGP